jgi:hypothetical protein
MIVVLTSIEVAFGTVRKPDKDLVGLCGLVVNHSSSRAEQHAGALKR